MMTRDILLGNIWANCCGWRWVLGSSNRTLSTHQIHGMSDIELATLHLPATQPMKVSTQ